MNIKKIAVRLFKSFPYRIRNPIYNMCGIKTNGADIRSNVFITNPSLLHIGKNVLINHNCSFFMGAGNATITFGNNVQVGPGCLFTTISHDYSNPNMRAGEISYTDIIVGDGSWIAASSTILPGVTIGKGCVVTAGAVVTKSIPDNQMWGGVPARFIKELN